VLVVTETMTLRSKASGGSVWPSDRDDARSTKLQRPCDAMELPDSSELGGTERAEDASNHMNEVNSQSGC